MFLFKDFITKDICRKHKDFLYVFGDNMAGYGLGGQAIIRNEPNSYGIVTKWEPTMSPAAFFSDTDNEIAKVKRTLDELDELNEKGKIIILPLNPVGSGYAKLDKYSPKVYKLICDWWDSKPKLYTGNFSSMKKHKNKDIIDITRVQPRWLKGAKKETRLAPKLNILMDYKKGIINDDDYIYEFDKVLRKLLPIEIIKDILIDDKDKVLCCYCTKDTFCHRHLVGEWLEDALDITINEVGKYRTKRKLGKAKED